MLPKKEMIQDAVDIAALDAKLHQKRRAGVQSEEELQKGLTYEERELLEYQKELMHVDAEDRLGQIVERMSMGTVLNEEEICYLQQNAPEKYQNYVAALQERNHYEEQLRACSSKEEMERLHSERVAAYMEEVQKAGMESGISGDDRWKKLEGLMIKVAMADAVYEQYSLR